jgi:hypothetical protein
MRGAMPGAMRGAMPGAMPTLAVGMKRDAANRHHAHFKRGHGARRCAICNLQFAITNLQSIRPH